MTACIGPFRGRSEQSTGRLEEKRKIGMNGRLQAVSTPRGCGNQPPAIFWRGLVTVRAKFSASRRRAVVWRQPYDEVGSHATEAGKPQAFRCAGKRGARPSRPSPRSRVLPQQDWRRAGGATRDAPTGECRRRGQDSPQAVGHAVGGKAPVPQATGAGNPAELNTVKPKPEARSATPVGRVARAWNDAPATIKAKGHPFLERAWNGVQTGQANGVSSRNRKERTAWGVHLPKATWGDWGGELQGFRYTFIWGDTNEQSRRPGSGSAQRPKGSKSFAQAWLAQNA